ncbi:MAG: ABC transporter permease [Candidatus Lambdaproteobacteria bacterium]|nr:ABC transporter permease [Candidatus Lambdaproteobacteria bacterium]
MGQFLSRRALQSVFSLFGLIVLVFFLVRLTGDPAVLFLPINASEEEVRDFTVKHGYDKPIYVQFLKFLEKAVRLDFGTSIRRNVPAVEAVFEAYPFSLRLAAVTMLLSIVIALVVGSLAAYKPNSLFDRLASVLSLMGASTPGFWIAIMGILVFAVQLRWLPTSGVGGVPYWIMPIATLALRPTGVMVQVLRGNMVATMSTAFITTARAKGLPERSVVFVHALRNSLISLVTVAGDQAVGLVNGAVVIETVFGWPGIGKLMIDAILQRDFALVETAVMVTALAIFALNIVIDLIYAYLDPRIRLA